MPHFAKNCARILSSGSVGALNPELKFWFIVIIIRSLSLNRLWSLKIKFGQPLHRILDIKWIWRNSRHLSSRLIDSKNQWIGRFSQSTRSIKLINYLIVCIIQVKSIKNRFKPYIQIPYHQIRRQKEHHKDQIQ